MQNVHCEPQVDSSFALYDKQQDSLRDDRGMMALPDQITSFQSPADARAATASVPIYVINLDRAPSRWQRLQEQAAKGGYPVTRIAAVDGRAVDPDKWVDFHLGRFKSHNGRKPLPGEYGCYTSHLMALERFAESGDEVAIICEDDIDLDDRITPRAIAALNAVPTAGLIKLVNHRIVGFRPVAKTAEGDVVGRCLHGPQGSAACYVVTRKAAKTLLQTLRPMFLPYDVALERAWETGVETYTTRDNVAAFSPLRTETSIGKTGNYRDAKKHFLLRTEAHLFRTLDQMQRWRYVLSARPR